MNRPRMSWREGISKKLKCPHILSQAADKIAMSFISRLLNADMFGTLWRPDPGGIRVGRDVGALTSTGFSRGAPDNVIVSRGDDVELKSADLFNKVRDAARKGENVTRFRSISPQDLVEGKVSSGNTVYKNGDYCAAFADGTLTISKRNAETGKFDQVLSTKIREDTKVVWNENGEPQLLTGRSARTEGVLKAEGENELLFRVSDCDVQAGAGTVVYNLCSSSGTYSGGDNVTYLGAYEGGTFTETTGKVTFGGYFNGASFSKLTGISEFSGVFEAAAVDLADGKGSFSGYFSASAITGSADHGNTMDGIFLDACTIQGGDGDDTFNGRFINSTIDGGEGDNSFGDMGMNLMRTLTAEADFINSSVSSGAGRDNLRGVVWGGSFDLGDGDDSVDGVFSQTTISGGSGNDRLKADYANAASFDTGRGDDVVDLTTAVNNTVTTGEGSNRVSMGRNDVSGQAKTWQTAEEHALRTRPTQTGELARNTVVAHEGENAVTINNGQSTRRLATSDGQKQAGQGDAVDDGPAEENPPKAQPQGDGTDRAMVTAIKRYRLSMVTGSETARELAATVIYADGSRDNINAMTRREKKYEDPAGGMVRMVRRYGSDGSVSWDRWMRLAG